jgi:hypothetical protein
MFPCPDAAAPGQLLYHLVQYARGHTAVGCTPGSVLALRQGPDDERRAWVLIDHIQRRSVPAAEAAAPPVPPVPPVPQEQEAGTGGLLPLPRTSSTSLLEAPGALRDDAGGFRPPSYRSGAGLLPDPVASVSGPHKRQREDSDHRRPLSDEGSGSFSSRRNPPDSDSDSSEGASFAGAKGPEAGRADLRPVIGGNRRRQRSPVSRVPVTTVYVRSSVASSSSSESFSSLPLAEDPPRKFAGKVQPKILPPPSSSDEDEYRP